MTLAVQRSTGITVGSLVRLKSFWMGFHYSDEHKRLCINIVPCVTVWIVFDGGTIPNYCDK
jgi:hypothetical protein